MEVGDFMLVIIFACYWQNFDIGDIFWMLVPDVILKKIESVDDENCQNSQQNLKFVANTFCLSIRH